MKQKSAFSRSEADSHSAFPGGGGAPCCELVAGIQGVISFCEQRWENHLGTNLTCANGRRLRGVFTPAKLHATAGNVLPKREEDEGFSLSFISECAFFLAHLLAWPRACLKCVCFFIIIPVSFPSSSSRSASVFEVAGFAGA